MKIRMIVQGQGIDLICAKKDTVESVCEKALVSTGNVHGSVLRDWEARLMSGRMLDLLGPMSQVGEDPRIFLNPRAGIGGNIPKTYSEGISPRPNKNHKVFANNQFNRKMQDWMNN